jgi:hypothetical protein
MIKCCYCQSETDGAHYDRVVFNKCNLHGEWYGWRMAGQFLVGPHGERFTPDRLAAIAHADKAKKRFGRVGNVLAFAPRGNSTKQASE